MSLLGNALADMSDEELGQTIAEAAIEAALDAGKTIWEVCYLGNFADRRGDPHPWSVYAFGIRTSWAWCATEDEAYAHVERMGGMVVATGLDYDRPMFRWSKMAVEALYP